MLEKEWFAINNIHDIDSPFLAVFPERVKSNIQSLKEMIPTNRLRPHVKTHKCKQAVTLMLEEGISKFKCATIAEAEMLALAGATDVLLAFQPIGPKTKRLLNLITSYPATTFACLLDNEETAKSVAASAKANHLIVNVWLDLDVGMNRTGIHPSDAFWFYRKMAGMRGITTVGIHACDGYITEANRTVRKRKCTEVFRKVETVRNEIINSGLPMPFVNIGRTATLALYPADPEIEYSPGTFIYWDQRHQQLYPELPFVAAALVVARCISISANERLCLDLGNKAVSSEGNLQQRVHFINMPNFEIIEQSEEHMVVKCDENHTIKPGDVVYGIPYDIGRTCNLYQTASTVYNHQVKGQWIHYTGRKLSV